MSFEDLFRWQSREAVAIAIAVIVFVLFFSAMKKIRFKNTGIALVISIVIALILGWNLYKGDYALEIVLKVLIVVFVIGIFIAPIYKIIRRRRAS